MTSVIEQCQPEPTAIAGIAHATWAGEAHGLAQLSVWRQSLAPGAGTPPHLHDCDEAVICLGGEGELHTEGRQQRFGARSILVLPRGRVHQIFNIGTEPLEVLGMFGQSPVPTRRPDGEPLPLPWRS
ncbi:cupin domain-containing protein [Cupriavidus malaysiensis]|uniref:cupin domain-containing protein n=1 Tax=Cupriavidus malaysiensis TaxID=367825 RepID=UPI000A009907|nr:cupin domain-containing protein [Cupriavidus malaysiensis]